jgi:putative peptidoglycan lipid II flippase
MLNITEILFILLMRPFLSLPITGLAIGVVVGGLAQMLFQLVPIAKRIKNFIPIFDFSHPGLRRIITLMLPAVLGISIMQISSFVDTICATLLKSGSVSHLYYGNRLVQLPLALFGTAVATVTLPMMSKNAALNEVQKLKDMLAFGLRTISFLIIPCTVGLIVLGKPIIAMLFQRGKFMAADTSATAWILSFYALGLIFYAGVKIAASAFYSLQDTKTPVIISSISMLINVALNIVVVTVPSVRAYFGAGGLALATAIASAVNFALLIVIFRKRNGIIGGKGVIIAVSKHILAAGLMGISIYYLAEYTAAWSVFVSVPVLIAIAAIIYALASLLLSTPELKQTKI